MPFASLLRLLMIVQIALALRLDNMFVWRMGAKVTVLRIVLLALVACVWLTLSARAEIILQRIDTDRGVVILLKGAFALADDPQALAREVSATGAKVITFDSDGGNVVSAIAYGRVIRSLGLSSFQPRATQCVSACALAFVG
ncbi:hypothetical protein CN207_36605, partial [Sinorhizobium meliloti]